MQLHRLTVQTLRKLIKPTRARAAGMIEWLEPRTFLSTSPPALLRDPAQVGSFVEAGDKTFFIGSGSTLNFTNGTAGGTFALQGVGKIAAMTGIGSDVYLTTDTGVWRSDGTTAGTVHVLGMYNNIGGVAHTSGFVGMGGNVYFYAQVPNVATGLWRTDGTPGGTTLVTPAHADALTPVGDLIYFTGPDLDGPGNALWATDGTPAGTRIVTHISSTPSPGSGDSSTRPAAVVGGKLVFIALGPSGSYNLYVSDGTAEGTALLTADVGVYGELANFGGSLYFSGFDASAKQELWKTDGTAAGTVLVKELPGQAAGFANRMTQLTVAGDTLYFVARDGDFRCNLWKSDGTAAGTAVIKGSATGTPFIDVYNVTNVAGTLAFTAATSRGYSLWISDGTSGGTVKIRDTFTNGMSGAYGQIGSSNSIALFTANDGIGLPELWALQTAATPPLPAARAEMPSPYSVGEGSTLQLHGYTSADALPGRPLTYSWDLDGDGVFGETGPAAVYGDETGTDPTLNASSLDGPGAQVVRFRVSDVTGYTSTAEAKVTVRNEAPTLFVTGGPAVLVQGNAYTVALSSSDAGPDTIDHWVIDWGDGVPQTVPGATASVTHIYPSTPALYGLSVKAVDEDGEYRFEPPAALDTGFGAGGIAYSADAPVQLAVQPDGKILTLSSLSSLSSSNTAIVVTRRAPGGTLDLTFGNGGSVIFNPSTYGEAPASIALQPDGRIVVAGELVSSSVPSPRGAILLRLLPDGSLDPSFGGGPNGGAGWVTYRFGAYEWFGQIGLTSDGHIIAGANVDQVLALFRFNRDGSLDAGFGSGGRVATDILADAGGARDIAIQPDGKILVLPDGYPPTLSFLVMRFNADGTPDTSFDGDGRATVEFGYGTATAASLALTADNSIVVAGSTASLPSSPQPGGYDAVVAKLKPDGTLDSMFADVGRLRTAPQGAYDRSQPLQGMVRPIVRAARDGGFLLAGSFQLNLSRWAYVVDRYHLDGTADTGFAPAGRLAVDLEGSGNSALLRDIALQRDGAPLLFGGAGAAHNPVGALVRLSPPGLSVRVVDAAAPEISVSASPATAEGAAYTIGLGGNDPDGDGITEWVVNWGDGLVQVVPGNTATLTHIYVDGPRAFVLRASAVDGDRSISSVSTAVSVVNVPPNIQVAGGPPVVEGSPYSVQFSATDPGTDTVSQWTINWGDGKTQRYTRDVRAAQHVYADNGVYAVTVTATDEDGAYSAAPVSAEIGNVAPTLDPLGPRVAASGAGFELVFTARDVVPETFSGTVDWGDGTAPSQFAATATSPLAVYTFAVGHTYAARGNYTATVRLEDGDGGSVIETTGVRVGDVVVRVYEDTNGSGVRDASEPAHAGTNAFLDLNRDGTPNPGEPTGTADAFGEVLFDALSAMPYAVRLVIPSFWHIGTPVNGSVEVTPGTESAVATFGLIQTATATGRVFDDPNGNGVRDTGEGQLLVQVNARRVDTGANAGPLSVLAGADGVYRFTGLLPGQYVIELANTTRVITAPAGLRGHLITVSGAEAEFAGLDIGSYAGDGGTITGTLYRDADGSGTRDATEPGIFNRTVYVDANENGVQDGNEMSAVTGGSGSWSIPRVAPGTHHVRQVLPPGWQQTSPGGGDGAARIVTVVDGQVVVGIDFGTTLVPAKVVSRQVFYNDSVFDGGSAGASAGDDGAIAADKQPLLAGRAATFTSVTSYDKGLNGVMVDIANLPAGETLTAEDFDFGTAGSPTSVTVRRGAGAGGSDRVTLIWRDYNPLDASPLPQAVGNGWLTVTVKANSHTGLALPDVFSFGSLIGESGDGGGAAGWRVNAQDLAAVKRAVNAAAPPDSRTDFNRDGVTNAQDLAQVKRALNRGLAPPAASPVVSRGVEAAAAPAPPGGDGPRAHRVADDVLPA